MIVQKARTVWADEATYDQALELVTLHGNVRMKNTGKEELKDMHDAETVTVSLNNDWVDILAKKGGTVSMDLEVKDQEEPLPTTGTAKPDQTKAQPAATTAPPDAAKPQPDEAKPQPAEGADKQ